MTDTPTPPAEPKFWIWKERAGYDDEELLEQNEYDIYSGEPTVIEPGYMKGPTQHICTIEVDAFDTPEEALAAARRICGTSDVPTPTPPPPPAPLGKIGPEVQQAIYEQRNPTPPAALIEAPWSWLPWQSIDQHPDRFYDGDSYLVAVRFNDHWQCHIISASFDSETPISFNDSYGDNFSVCDWEDLELWINLTRSKSVATTATPEPGVLPLDDQSFDKDLHGIAASEIDRIQQEHGDFSKPALIRLIRLIEVTARVHRLRLAAAETNEAEARNGE